MAVIDTGFALNHEDLADKWYINQKEVDPALRTNTACTGDPRTNGCDDDGNGYVDDWRGWNFNGRYTPTSDDPCTTGWGSYVANNNPMAGESGSDVEYAEILQCYGTENGDPYEAISHGTTVAGLVGASTNNGKGIASFNWNVKIMPLQALSDDGSGWTGKITAAIRYAVDNGASIINLSLGSEQKDLSVISAVNYAYSKGVVVVAASGNCGTGEEYGCLPSEPGIMSYPALYDHVIAVGSTNSSKQKSSFSSYGPGMDVVAPGEGAIISTLINRPAATYGDKSTFNFTSGYSSYITGTSFSAPIVSSIASLIRSERPNSTVDEVISLIDGSATKVPAMNGSVFTNEYGHGLIDANSIVTIAQSLNTTGTEIPKLGQTGDHRSEHSFSPSASMSSGCTVTNDSYCTVRAYNLLNGYDRYLPYTNTGSTGQAGWTWPGSMLTIGEWSVSAIQGEKSSPQYYLFSK